MTDVDEWIEDYNKRWEEFAKMRAAIKASRIKAELEEIIRLKKLTNEQLVEECQQGEDPLAKHLIVIEMMDRLVPGWEYR